ncbi:hypothetical protein BS47DRAFT_1340624 [Hydnum rufescens UP504]|uniref:DUF6593 domain-containing protein n=1 Tax=Hydnum rufescens UP504 TaxID=1448309 RepID=A0A9P6B3D6_9AGAM|nr:hypothetical protein BS47DRAFT_1340624 [Hydnum rufescens UP504]
MSSLLGTLRLEYSFPHIHENHPWDVLNGTVYVLYAGERVALYYFQTWLPSARRRAVVTQCLRYNLLSTPYQDHEWRKIEWKNNYRRSILWTGPNAAVEFDSLLGRSYPDDGFRRFTACDGIEYKWRQTGPHNRHLECYPPSTPFGQPGPIAAWDPNSHILTIPTPGHQIIDDLACTLLIHYWRLRQDYPW